ncbi:MAG: NYN domain-containing protein [Chloroflexi bacterium]|nr:NYN domain-containing protein [Chloroflexota bacterium]
MISCYVYIDGAYVRFALRKRDLHEDFDPTKPAASVQNYSFEGQRVYPSRVFYYDAIDSNASQTEQTHRRDYFRRVEHLPQTHVLLGEVRTSPKAGQREQKGVDVQMAIDSLRAATSRGVKAIALVTGDADFAPLARAIRESGPYVLVLAFAESLSDNLAREADWVHIWNDVPGDWGLLDQE